MDSALDTGSATVRRTLVQRWFTDHPDTVNETYLEHLRAALGFAGTFAMCAACCLVHAVVPGLCTTSASRRLDALQQRIHRQTPTDNDQ